MGFFQKFPYTDDHQLNLDWILRLFKTLHGGVTGQILKKRSNKDFDWEWGTSDYNDLTNKPQINGVTLSGNKSTSDLFLSAPVTSVNGQTGAVVLDADDVGAAPDEALDGKNPVVLTLIHGSIDASGVITTGGTRWISDDYLAGNVVYEVTNNTAGNVYVDYYDYDNDTDAYIFQYSQAIRTGNTSLTDNSFSHIRFYAYNPGATADLIVINKIIRIARLNKLFKQQSLDIPFYLLAHRGARTLAPENTLPAFALAAKRGYNIIETDLRWTSDGVPVLLHNSDINTTARNADGTDIGTTVYIADITYAQALDYDFGIAFGPEFAGTKIPTLEEGLALCKQLGMMMSLELKVHSGVSVEMRADVLSKIKEAGMQGKVFLTSFRYYDLRLMITSPEWEYGLCGLWINTSAVDLDTQHADNDITMADAVRYLSAWQTDVATCGIHWSANRLTDAIAEAVADSGISLGAFVIDTTSDIIALPKSVTAVTTNSVTFEDIANTLSDNVEVGIQKSELSAAVQTSLDKADSAYQKPPSGIPGTDLASGVIPSPEVAWFTYGTSTSAEIEAAYQAGKICMAISGRRTLILGVRGSATSHTFFSATYGTVYQVKCDSDTWTNTSRAIPAASTDTPQPLGTAAAGNGTTYARNNHVHAMPTASDVGAIPAPVNPTTGQVLMWDGSAWIAANLP